MGSVVTDKHVSPAIFTYFRKMYSVSHQEVRYKKARVIVREFLTTYWIPANVSSGLLEVGTTVAYEWTEDLPKVPRKAWSFSTLYPGGQTRRQLAEKAVMLYAQEEVSITDVSDKLGRSRNVIFKYLKAAEQRWFSRVKTKHEDFTATYPGFARQVHDLYTREKK